MKLVSDLFLSMSILKPKINLMNLFFYDPAEFTLWGLLCTCLP